jgi:hypothetical protein
MLTASVAIAQSHRVGGIRTDEAAADDIAPDVLQLDPPAAEAVDHQRTTSALQSNNA